MNPTSKIMIGSAQFGMKYGIANQCGQTNENDISKILELALAKQILKIDTASQYGESEHVLGSIASRDFKFFTKLRPIPINININNIDTYINNQFIASLKNLKRESCEGLLIHHAADLLGPHGQEIYHALSELKTKKLINKIGVSVYTPEQAIVITDRYKIDIIQFPINILDQRFLQNQLLQTLKIKKIELHARSLFLQGLLLMELNTIPTYFHKILPTLTALHNECKNQGISIRQALIEFVSSITEIDQLIFGIDNYQQFVELIDNVQHCKTPSRILPNKYLCDDMDIINPMNWKIQ